MALFALITGLAITIKNTQSRRTLKTVVGRGDERRCVCVRGGRGEGWRVEMGGRGQRGNCNNNENGTLLLVNEIFNYYLASYKLIRLLEFSFERSGAVHLVSRM